MKASKTWQLWSVQRDSLQWGFSKKQIRRFSRKDLFETVWHCGISRRKSFDHRSMSQFRLAAVVCSLWCNMNHTDWIRIQYVTIEECLRFFAISYFHRFFARTYVFAKVLLDGECCGLLYLKRCWIFIYLSTMNEYTHQPSQMCNFLFANGTLILAESNLSEGLNGHLKVFASHLPHLNRWCNTGVSKIYLNRWCNTGVSKIPTSSGSKKQNNTYCKKKERKILILGLCKRKHIEWKK